MDPGWRLGLVLGEWVRPLLYAQGTFLIVYPLFRQLVPTLNNSDRDAVEFGFRIALQVCAILVECTVLYAPRVASAALDLALVVVSLCVLLDAYTLADTVQTRHVDVSLAFEAAYLALDVLMTGAQAYVRLGFDWRAWGAYARAWDASMFDPVSGEYRWVVAALPPEARALVTPAYRAMRGFVILLVTCELATLFAYILGMVAAEPDPGITGWLFLLHAFTAAGAIAWAEGRPPPPGRFQWLISIACFTLLLDIIVMATPETPQPAALVGMRVLLVFCAAGYALAMVVGGTRAVVPSRVYSTFVALQFVVSSLLVWEVATLAFYFCYAFAVVRVRGAPVLWSNLVHCATALAAVGTLAADEPVPWLALLAVASAITAVYDGVILGTLALMAGPPPPGAYVPQAFLAVASVGYFATAAAVWTLATRRVLVQYAQCVADEGTVLARAYALVRRRAPPSSISELQDADAADLPPGPANAMEAAQRGAARLYYGVAYVVRAGLVVDMVMLTTYLLILAGTPGTQWWEWFAAIHVLTVVAGLILVSFTVPASGGLIYLVASALACLVVDATFIGLLWASESPALLALQSVYLLIDVYYVAAFALIVADLPPAAYVMLRRMHRLADRIEFEGALVGGGAPQPPRPAASGRGEKEM